MRPDPGRKTGPVAGAGCIHVDGDDGRHFAPAGIQTQALIAVRRQRVAERLHRLGARALAELLAEIGPGAEALAAEYARRLTVELLAAAGSNKFPRPPLHLARP